MRPFRPALGLAALCLLAGAARADYVLHVLHTNDLHSRIEPVNAFGADCSPEQAALGECFGGVARLAAKVAELRAALDGRNLLLLDAGDQFQGSLFYVAYKGAAEAEFMEAIGYDAMAVGNHEFDDGPEGLAAFLDRVSFPVISGNIDVSQTPGLAGRILPHVVLERGGERIGVVSALATDTPETSSPGPTVAFRDEIEALRESVSALEAEGVTKILALTHVGVTRDMEIAATVAGIDAVVGGHSHTLMANDAANALPYPVMVPGPDGRLTPVVQAGSNSMRLGWLTLTFDEAGQVTDAAGDTILLDASVTPDPAVAARVAELAEPLETIRSEVVGETIAPIDGDRLSCRAAECEMGVLVTDAMLAASADEGTQIAIQNGGGLRASIDAGPVTRGEVLTVLPFQNTLATFRLKGADVIAALENGLSQVAEGAGRFPQVGGMRFAWDPTAPPGARVVSAEVETATGFAPLDPEAVYSVATNDYMRRGGDGYAVFAENGMDAYDFGPSLDLVVADHLAANSPYEPRLEGRITIAE